MGNISHKSNGVWRGLVYYINAMYFMLYKFQILIYTIIIKFIHITIIFYIGLFVSKIFGFENYWRKKINFTLRTIYPQDQQGTSKYFAYNNLNFILLGLNILITILIPSLVLSLINVRIEMPSQGVFYIVFGIIAGVPVMMVNDVSESYFKSFEKKDKQWKRKWRLITSLSLVISALSYLIGAFAYAMNKLFISRYVPIPIDDDKIYDSLLRFLQ